MVAPDLLNRGDGLVAKEAVRIVECRDECVHRSLRAELGQRRRNVTTDPDLFALIAKRMCQRADDGLAVADERLASRRFQCAVPEQRQEPGDEQSIGGAQDRKSTRLNSSHSQISY